MIEEKEVKALSIFELSELKEKGYDIIQVETMDPTKDGLNFFIAIAELTFSKEELENENGIEIIKFASERLKKTLNFGEAEKN